MNELCMEMMSGGRHACGGGFDGTFEACLDVLNMYLDDLDDYEDPMTRTLLLFVYKMRLGAITLQVNYFAPLHK